MAGSRTSPKALTTTSAATFTPPDTSSAADPRPDFVAWEMPNSFPTVAPVPAPTQPSGNGPGCRLPTRGVGHARVRPRRRVAQAQIEQDGRGDDGHPRDLDVEAHATFLQVPHDPAGRVQAEGGPSGQQDGVHEGDEVHRGQRVHLPRAGRGAANVHPADRAVRTQNDRTPRAADLVRPVSDPNSRNGSQHDQKVRLRFALPGVDHRFDIPGMVVWVNTSPPTLQPACAADPPVSDARGWRSAGRGSCRR